MNKLTFFVSDHRLCSCGYKMYFKDIDYMMLGGEDFPEHAFYNCKACQTTLMVQIEILKVVQDALMLKDGE